MTVRCKHAAGVDGQAGARMLDMVREVGAGAARAGRRRRGHEGCLTEPAAGAAACARRAGASIW